MTRDLEALSLWLAEWGCSDVAMESTGVYWQPVYNVLEGQFTIWLVNAHHVKQVPGRKTDVNDAAWLAQLLQHGLLKRSNIPPVDQRELRDLTRYRQSLVEERNRVANRLQKVLEDANLKLASVATNIQGVSAQEILRTLIGGESDPASLAQLARGKLQKKQAELEQALTGRFRSHHRFLLTQLLGHLDFLDAEIATLEERIEEMLATMPPFEAAVVRLDSIPGINRTTALIIVAEIGVDISRYPSDRHLAAWAGLAPGNNETGGKQRGSKTRKGNRYLRRALVQAARAAARKKGSYLKAMYHRLAHRRGANRAAVAVARRLLQIAYHLIAREQTYQDAEAHVLLSLAALTSDPTLITEVADEVVRLAAAEPAVRPNQDARKIEEQIRRLGRLYQAGLKTDAEFETDLRVLQSQLAASRMPAPSRTPAIDRALALLKDLPTLLAQATNEERRMLLQEVFDSIYLTPHQAMAVRPAAAYTDILKALDESSAFNQSFVQWAGWGSGLDPHTLVKTAPAVLRAA